MADMFTSEICCALGASFACVSSASTVIGMLCQKEGLTRENRALFYLGVLIFTFVKPGAQIIALFLAPVSLIAPLASLAVLLNAVIVPWCRGERLSQRDAWAGIMLMAGCTGAMAMGPHNTHMLSYAELCDLAAKSKIPTMALASLTLVLAVRLKAVARAQHSELASTASSRPCLFLGVVVAAFVPAAASALNNVVIKVLLQGLLSGFKLSVVPLVGALFCTAFLQVWSTTIGVQLFDMLVYVPVQVTEQILVTIMYGGIFFEEAPSNPPAFIGFTLTILLGVLLSQDRPTAPTGHDAIGKSIDEKRSDEEAPDEIDYTLMGA